MVKVSRKDEELSIEKQNILALDSVGAKDAATKIHFRLRMVQVLRVSREVGRQKMESKITY